MADIKNEFELNYDFEEESYTETATCEVELNIVKPDVIMAKVPSTTSVSVGDTITYYVTIQVGAGDDYFGKKISKDNHSDNIELIDGTLKINGEVAEVQDLSQIELDLAPSTIITVEYQCLVIG